MMKPCRRKSLFGLFVLALGACSAETNPITQQAALATCEIVDPVPNAALGANDDRDLTAADIQIDVQVRTANAPVGASLQLSVNGLFAQVARLDAAAGVVRFTNVTLPRGPAAARLGCSVAGTEARSESLVAVGDSCALRFAQPLGGATINREATRAGANGRPVHSVVVEASGLPAGTPVQLVLGDANAPQYEATATLSPGRATFEIPAFQGRSQLSARAVGGSCSPTAEVVFNVDLGLCETQLNLPRAFNAAADTSADPGLQTRLCLTTQCADGSRASLRVDAGTELSATVSNGQACFDVSIPEGTPSITAHVDGPVQSGIAPAVRPCVDVTPPVLALTSPAPRVVAGVTDDRDPATPDVLDLAVAGVADGLAAAAGCAVADSRARIEIKVDGELQAAFAPTAPGGAFERLVRIMPGTSRVEVCAYDALENRACAPPSDVTFVRDVPSLRITSPIAGSVLGIDRRFFDVTVESKRLPTATAVTLSTMDGGWVCVGRINERLGAGSAVFHVGGACAGLGDGTHRLVARATDTLHNVAQSAPLTIVIDTVRPVIAFTSLPEQSATSAAYVDVTLRSDAADGAQIELKVNDDTAILAPVFAGGVTFHHVELRVGESVLTARISDAAGNVASASVRITRDSSAPVPSFKNLVSGQVLRAEDDSDSLLDNGVQYSVEVVIPAEADGIRVTLQAGESAPVEGVLSNSGVVFEGVTFAEGMTRVTVVATDFAGNVGTASVDVRVATGRPEVSIRLPSDAQTVGLQNDVDPEMAGVQIPVLVSVLGGLATDACSLLVTNGAAISIFPLTHEGSTCRGVITLADGTSSMVAKLASPVPGLSVPVRITLDTQAPVLSMVAPAGGVINGSALDLDGRPGFQTDIVVAVDSIEAGQGATMRVIPDDTGIPAIYYAQFGADGRVTFRAVTLGSPSSTTIEVDASDRASNAAVRLIERIVVDRDPPEVSITKPVADQLFGRSADESSAPGFQKTIALSVAGVEAGHTVQLTLVGTNDGDIASTYVSAPVSGLAGEVVTFSGVTFPETTGSSMTIRATVTDSAGNEASHSLRVGLDFAPSAIDWTSPVAGAQAAFCAGADTDAAAPGFQTTLVLSATDLANGTVVVVRDAAGNEVGRGNVARGQATVVATLAEGESLLRAFAVKASGDAVESSALAVRVDSQGPMVIGISCDGDRNIDGWLSRAEDGNPSTANAFEMGCIVTFADASADGREVSIHSSAPSQGTVVGQAVALGSQAFVQVSLAGGTTPVGHTLFARTTDACGNASSNAGGNGAAGYSATVDLSSPTASIVAPGAGTLIATADRNPATESVLECCTGASGAYDITATTSGAAGTARLYANGVMTAQATISNGVVRFPSAGLPQGSVSLTVEVASPSGNAGASSPVALFIDTVAPKLAIESPVAGGTSGQFVSVALSYRDLEAGRLLAVYDGTRLVWQGAAGMGGESSTRTASISLLLQPGAHSLSAVASDGSGNSGRATAVAFTVQAGDPVVTMESPAGNPLKVNRASGDPIANHTGVHIVARTQAPVGSQVVVEKNGILLASGMVVAGTPQNVATLSDLQFSDGDTGTVQLRLRLDPSGTNTPCPGDANNFCGALVPYSVDLVAPTLSFAQPACKAIWSAADQSGGAWNVRLTTDADGRTVTLTSSVGGLSRSAAAQGGSVLFDGLALGQGSQSLEARVQDAAGNEQVARCTVDVDGEAPVATPMTAARSLVRRDRVTLSFTMPGEDGATGSVASYELRWRSCAIGAQCAMTAADFATAALVTNLPAIAAGGTAMNVDADGMPLGKHVEFALRAVDHAGNASAVVTAAVDTPFASQAVAGDTSEIDYGFSIKSAHVTGQANADLIIGRPRQLLQGGGLRVVYSDGRATTNITAAQVGLTVTNARMGRAVNGAGDVDGDGYEDIIVGAPGIADATCTSGATGPTGRAYLFFGGPSGVRSGASPVSCAAPGATEDCYIEIPAPAGSGVCSFGASVAGLGHVSDAQGQTRSMFAVGASDLQNTSTRMGKVFVYRITGDRPNITVELVSTIAGGADDYHFGAAVCGVGDVNGDGIPDMVVGAHRRGQTPTLGGRAYVVLGGARFSGAGAQESVAGHASTTDGIVRLGDPTSTTDNFAASCTRTGDMDGDGFNDFAVSAAGVQRVFVYRGRADFDARPSMAAPDVVTLSHTAWTQPGELSGGYDVDGDGLPDLVIGDSTAAYVYRGDHARTVAPDPIATFTQTVSVSSGFPVLMMPSFADAATGEAAFPDIAIGKVGASVTVRY